MKSPSSDALGRCKPSGRRHQLARDSLTALPTTTTRRKAGSAARLSGSSSAIAHRKVIHPVTSASTSTTDTSSRTHRLGAPTPLLGKDHAGYEECSPIIIHPRALLERYPRRVAQEDSNNYSGNFNDPINASLSYATLCPREPAVSLSRTQLAPSQQPIPANTSFRIATATLGNPHTVIAVDRVPSAQRAPRSSSSNLDVEGWPTSSPESTPSKHHKQSMPMRIHSQRMERPIEYEHMGSCWNQGRDWDQRLEMQEDMMPCSGRGMPAPVTVGVAVGNGSGNSMPSGGCHHHRRLTNLPDQNEQFYYQESNAVNTEWETKHPMTQTASFTAFPRNYTSLQVPSQRTYHSTVSPLPQEPYVSNSPNASPSRNNFSCNQQPTPFPNSYSCLTPTCCNQGSPMTPTNGGRTSTTNVAQQHTSNHGHSHFGGFPCPNMHQSRSPTIDSHFHQFGPPVPSGPISASGSNTSANMTIQMHNNQTLRRAVRPPRTMLLNAAAAGTNITNSRGRTAARQNLHGRRPFRTDHSMSYTRVHHCRRVSITDCPHRIACRVHHCSLNHLPRSSTCQ